MEHTINLVLGDWSHDGHSISETIMIKSNLDRKNIEIAYKQGAKIVGIDVTKEIAVKYEDDSLQRDDYEKLTRVGLKFQLSSYDHECLKNDDYIALDTNKFVNMYLFLVKKGNPNFKYEIVNRDEDTIDIGGYGLFI